MDGNDSDTIRFVADAQAIAVAVGAARRFAEDHRIDPESAISLAIVIEELVTNLVEHGSAPSSPIELRLARHSDEVRLTLIDHGLRFDPRDAVTSPLPPERGGGAGLALVLAWSRVLDYRSESGRNHLVLSLQVNDPPMRRER